MVTHELSSQRSELDALRKICLTESQFEPDPVKSKGRGIDREDVPSLHFEFRSELSRGILARLDYAHSLLQVCN